MERLKAGWEDTLREREEFSERKIKNLEEQKDKGFHLSLIYCFVWHWFSLLLSQLVVPCMRRSTIGDRAFTVAAPRTWNSLPDSLHRLSSLEQFKKHLKTHLFKFSFVQQDSL